MKCVVIFKLSFMKEREGGVVNCVCVCTLSLHLGIYFV